MKRLSPSLWTAGLCALGFGLRLFRLTAASLSGDEGWAWSLNVKPLDGWLPVIAQDDHPPLYYFVLRPWSLVAGNSELALRLISVFAGVLAIALVYQLVRRLAGARAALIAAALLTCLPQHVDFSQEARMYTLLTALALGAALSLWQALTLPRPAAWAAWGAYVILMAGAVYCHYYGWLLWAAGVAYVLLTARGQRRVVALGLQGLVVLSFIPWALYAQVSSKTFPPPPGQWVYLTDWPAIAGVLNRSFNFGGTALPGQWAAFTAALTWLLAGAAGWQLWRRSHLRHSPSFIAVHLALPIGLILALSLFSFNVWFRLFGANDMEAYRFLLPLVPWFCGLVAAGLASVRPQALAQGALALTLVVEGGATGQFLLAPRHNKSDYREMVRDMRTQLQPGDGIFVLGTTQVFTFPYYAPDLPYTLFSPDRRLTPAETEQYQADISRKAAPYGRLWVLAGGGVAAYDPDDVTGQWLGQIGFIVYRRWYQSGELRLYILNQKTAPLHFAKEALVSGDIRCTGVDLNTPVTYAGQTLQVTLYWQATHPLPDHLFVFVHVLRADGSLAAQHDGEPGGGSRTTATWQTDETIVDRHAILLPADLPPGTYTLQAGFTPYWDRSRRLPVTGPDAQPAGDAVLLGTLEIKP